MKNPPKHPCHAASLVSGDVLAARVLVEEHKLYPAAVRQVLDAK